MANARSDSATTRVDTPVVIDVLANDSGGHLSIIGVTTPSNGIAAINANQTVTYTPAGGFVGIDNFVYTITGRGNATDSATVTVTVEAANRAPVANDVEAITTEDTPVVIDVLANDHDPDGDPLTVVELTQPANGSAALNDDQTVTYTPAAGFTGTDSFTYTIADPHGATDSATVMVTVEIANQAPVASDVEATTTEGTPVVIDVLANDHDPDGDPLTVVELTQPTNGTAALNHDQTVTYTPAAGFVGEDAFGYTIADTHGATDSATVTVTVHAEVGIPWDDDTLWEDDTGWVA